MKQKTAKKKFLYQNECLKIFAGDFLKFLHSVFQLSSVLCVFWNVNHAPGY